MRGLVQHVRVVLARPAYSPVCGQPYVPHRVHERRACRTKSQTVLRRRQGAGAAGGNCQFATAR